MTISDRIRELLNRGPRYGRYTELERQSGIKADTWKAVVAGRQRPTADVLGALLIEWPQLAAWILSGDSKCPQTTLAELMSDEILYGALVLDDLTIQIVVDIGGDKHIDVYAQGWISKYNGPPTELLYMQTTRHENTAQIEVLNAKNETLAMVGIHYWLTALQGRCKQSTDLTVFQRFMAPFEKKVANDAFLKFHLQPLASGEHDKSSIGTLKDAIITVSLPTLQSRKNDRYGNYFKDINQLFKSVGLRPE